MKLYVAKAGQRTGPFTETEVRSMVNGGLASANDLGWYEELNSWRPLHEILKISRAEPPVIPGNPPPLRTEPPLLPGTAPAHMDPAQGAATTGFFRISIARLLLMTFFSMGLYQAYWNYRNWRGIKQRDNIDIWPFLRGVFCVFYLESLLKGIRDKAATNKNRLGAFSPGGLAAGWVLFLVSGIACQWSPNWAIKVAGLGLGILNVCCLVPAQSYVNAGARESEGRKRDSLSFGQALCLFTGLAAWLVVIPVTVAKISGMPDSEPRPAPLRLVISLTPAPLPRLASPQSAANRAPRARQNHPDPMSRPASSQSAFERIFGDSSTWKIDEKQVKEFDDAVNVSLARAARYYPELNDSQSALYKAVVERALELGRKEPARLNDVLWPEKVTMEVTNRLGYKNARVISSLIAVESYSWTRDTHRIFEYIDTLFPYGPESSTIQEMTTDALAEKSRYVVWDAAVTMDSENEVRIVCNTLYQRGRLADPNVDVRRRMLFTVRPTKWGWKIYSCQPVDGN